MIATRRLYLTSDRRRVVFSGDPAAAFLLAAIGDEVPVKWAGQIGPPQVLPVDVVIAPQPKRKKK